MNFRLKNLPIALLPRVGRSNARRVYARGVAARLVWQLLLSSGLISGLISGLVTTALSTALPAVVHAQGAAAALTPISTIQGAGLASPFAEQQVTTWGVVTGVTPDGFYLQEPTGDGDPATSDGLYTYTYDAPSVTVGECVQVAGEVIEYYAKTELNWLTSIVPSDACSTRVISPVDLPRLRPGDDPVATLEALEGMVVRLEPMLATAHSPTKHFGSGEDEIAFLPAAWQRYLGPVHLYHDQAEVSGLLFLSNRLGVQLPTVQWGDLLEIGSNGLVGVLDYNFGKYQLLPLPDQTISVITNEVVASALPPVRGDEYGVCSFNLHGLGQGTAQFATSDDYATALRHRARLIATWLQGCTVIALQETGTPADAEALAAVLAAEHHLAYRALAIEGPASADEVFPLTNSILVDETRVTVELVDAVTGCAPQDFGIFAPGTCAAGAYPVFDRPPIVAKLVIDGPADAPWLEAQTMWMINNHWKSKSGDETENARLRAAQAGAVAERVQMILASDAAARIVVLGDLNDFYTGEAVAALQRATGLFHAYTWLPPLERYTYIFNGAAQVLDHALVTPNLAPQLSLVQILHIQADTAAGNSRSTYSDHDPVVLRLRPAGAATVGGNLAWGGIEIGARDSDGIELARTVTDVQGEFRLWGLPVAAVTLDVRAPEWILLDAPAPTLPAPTLPAQTVPAQTIDVQAGLVTPALPEVRHATAIAGAWFALNTPWLANTLVPD